MEFILTEKAERLLNQLHERFLWKCVSTCDSWYVLDKVMCSVKENVSHYATDLLYDVARLAPLMNSEEAPQNRFVAAFGIRDMGVDGIGFIEHRIGKYGTYYRDLFLLEELEDDYGRRIFNLYRMVGEAENE